MADPPSAVPQRVLEYAPPAPRTWGPWVVRPSIVTLTLLAATAAATWYLHRHNTPWVKVAQITGQSAARWTTFTQDGSLLITSGLAYPAQVWDADTGRLVHSLGEWGYAFDEHQLLDGEQVIISHRLWKGSASGPATTQNQIVEAQLWDTRTGHCLARMPMPTPYVPELMNNGRIAYTTDSAGLHVRQLPEGLRGEAQFIGTIPDTMTASMWEYTPDGPFLAVRDKNGLWNRVYDVSKPSLLWEFPGSHWWTHLLVPQRRILVVTPSPAGGKQLQVHSLDGGARLGTLPVSSLHVRPYVSQDRRLALVVAPAGGWTLWDLDTFAQRPFAPDLPPGSIANAGLFADGHRVLFTPRTGGEACICDTRLRWPVAVLPGPFAGSWEEPVLSTDGNHAAIWTRSNGIWLYRKVGRESMFGVLGLPQCWVLLACATLAAASLWLNARRRARIATPAAMSAFMLVLFVAGIVGTLKLLIDGCLGHARMNPGPLYLLCAIGLATRGRFWSVLTAIILAASLAAWGLALYRVWPSLNSNRSQQAILDRTWPVPSALLGALLGLWLLGVVAGVWIAWHDGSRKMA